MVAAPGSGFGGSLKVSSVEILGAGFYPQLPGWLFAQMPGVFVFLGVLFCGVSMSDFRLAPAPSRLEVMSGSLPPSRLSLALVFNGRLGALLVQTLSSSPRCSPVKYPPVSYTHLTLPTKRIV